MTMLPRRTFLSLGASPALLLRGSPNETVTVACIGAGWQGMNNVHSFLDLPAARVVAVCDLEPAHREKARLTVNAKYGNSDCRSTPHYEELLADPRIDAVALSLPDHWHGLAGVHAARAGKDIYGEKPLAHNYAEGQAIRDAVRRHQCIWQTGSWQRSLPQFRHACELVRNGRLGEVRRVEVGLPGGYNDFAGTMTQDTPCPPPPDFDYDRWLGPAPAAPYVPARLHKNWRYHLDYGGGLLLDWIGHHVDIAHWGLGLDDTGPVEVRGTGTFPGSCRAWNAPAMYRVEARYASGLTMMIEGDETKIRRGTRWIGERGWIYVDRNAFEAEPHSLLTEKLRPSEIRLPVSPGHHQQFLDCVRTRAATLTPPDVALRSATPGYLGLISILLNRTVRWDPAAEQILDDPVAARLLSRPMRAPYTGL